MLKGLLVRKLNEDYAVVTINTFSKNFNRNSLLPKCFCTKTKCFQPQFQLALNLLQIIDGLIQLWIIQDGCMISLQE